MRAAERALAIDSMLPAAHAASGNLLNAQWRWAEGRVELQRAVALDPTYAPAFQWLGENQLLNGDLTGAERSLAQAVRLDSTLSVTMAIHGVVLALLKRTNESDTLFARALAKTPSVAALHVIRATALLYANRVPDALRSLEVARVIDPSSPLVLGTLGYAQARAGNRAMVAELERELSRDGTRPGVAGALGKIKLGVGDTAAALDLFERALRERDTFIASEPLRSPIYAPLHRSERFARIVEAAGLDVRRVTAPGCC
jgi:tetratricopeptide (TPR) repeat protein